MAQREETRNLETIPVGSLGIIGGMQIPWRKSGSLSGKMAYHP